jgi:hypothetical protein
MRTPASDIGIKRDAKTARGNGSTRYVSQSARALQAPKLRDADMDWTAPIT